MDSPSSGAPNDTFDMRRARWLAAGVAADQRLQRATMVAVTLGCCFLVTRLLVLYVG